MSFAARHAVPSAALRFEVNGRILSFSSDTGDCPGVRAAAVDAELFVCEATWLAEPDAESAGHGHLSAAQAGRLAAAANVRTLVSTHLSDPDDGPAAVLRASTEFGGRLLLAGPGLRVD